MNLSIYFVTPDGVEDALVFAALQGGASVIQLRDKTATDAEMSAQARRLLPHLHEAGVPLIINDRVEAALSAKVDGLHIGQSDGDPTEIRKAIGPNFKLGLSVSTLDQLTNAPAGIVDYLGVGPVRATPTKPDHDTPIGFDGLRAITTATNLPVVAIGGISIADISEIRSSGCAGIAVVSAISAADNPETATRNLAARWTDA